MVDKIKNILDSETMNIVLTLLLLFQFFWNKAKEKSVKYNIFALRRITERSAKNKSFAAQGMLDLIDATLACLNSRLIFSRTLRKLVKKIRESFYKDEEGPLTK